jgi:hypothetical protein
MLEGTLSSFGLLLLGCFNATAAQDRRVNAGKFVTQLMFVAPALAGVAVAFMTNGVLGAVILLTGAYLWKELT